MPYGDRLVALAQRAADLLPEPPPTYDLHGYREWESLVLDTAKRIAVVAGVPAGGRRTPGPLPRHRVEWQELLLLASLPVPGDEFAEVDDLLRRIDHWWALRPRS